MNSSDMSVVALEAIESWIPRRSHVALVDVPVNRNVGDLFILAAVRRLLEALDCRIVYRAGVRDYRSGVARRAVGRDTIVVGLGGGNFGDIYPRYQALRERVVDDFPRNRIVVLPQSIHFRDARAVERCAARLGRHADLRIAVRDAPSAAVAQRFTPHVRMLPDVVDAMGIAAVAASVNRPVSVAPPRGGTLHLLRRDAETRGMRHMHQSVDWPDVFPQFRRRLAVAALAMPMALGTWSEALHRAWSDYARELLAGGIDYMRAVDRVTTDRLHAAIVARLAGRSVALRDNRYGKLAAYYDAWWRDDPQVTLEIS